MTISERYFGRPFLRLLECYVLWAMEELSNDQLKDLQKLEPKLCKTYNIEDSWHGIVAAVMELPETFAVEVKTLWDKNRKTAEENGIELHPQHFAEMFVDANFPEQ